MNDQNTREDRHLHPGTVRLRSNGREQEAQLRNAGPGGALLHGKELPEVGAQVVLLFEDEEERPPVRVTATIAHCPEQESRGVRFLRAHAPGGLLSLCRFLGRVAVGSEEELVDHAEQLQPAAAALAFDFVTREFVPRPRSIDDNSREATERAACSCTVTLRYGSETWHGTLRNLADSGAFVTCTQLPPIGCEVEMSIPHAPLAKTRAEVRWREDRSELGVGLGLRLLQPRGVDEEAAALRFRTSVRG